MYSQCAFASPNGFYSVCSQCAVCMPQRFIPVYCQSVFLSGVCATTDVGRTFRREFTLVREVRTTAVSRRLRKTDWCFYSVFVKAHPATVFVKAPSSRLVSKSLLNNSPPNSQIQTQTCLSLHPHTENPRNW